MTSFARPTDDDITRPGVHIGEVRRKKISSQSELDSVAILLGRLGSTTDYEAQHEIAKLAIHRAFEQGRRMGHTDNTCSEVELAKERQLRRSAESTLLDVRAAFLRVEREDADLSALRHILVESVT